MRCSGAVEAHGPHETKHVLLKLPMYVLLGHYSFGVAWPIEEWYGYIVLVCPGC